MGSRGLTVQPQEMLLHAGVLVIAEKVAEYVKEKLRHQMSVMEGMHMLNGDDALQKNKRIKTVH